MKKIALLALIMALFLSACTTRYATNAEKEYLKSRNGNMVVVPPPLSSANISHFYDLPDARENTVPSILPPE